MNETFDGLLVRSNGAYFIAKCPTLKAYVGSLVEFADEAGNRRIGECVYRFWNMDEKMEYAFIAMMGKTCQKAVRVFSQDWEEEVQESA